MLVAVLIRTIRIGETRRGLVVGLRRTRRPPATCAWPRSTWLQPSGTLERDPVHRGGVRRPPGDPRCDLGRRGRGGRGRGGRGGRGTRAQAGGCADGARLLSRSAEQHEAGNGEDEDGDGRKGRLGHGHRWPPRGRAQRAHPRLGRRPDGGRDRTAGRGREVLRAIVQPRGEDGVGVSRCAHADRISAGSRVLATAIAPRRRRVAWWSRDFTVPTGTPTISAIAATGRPA